MRGGHSLGWGVDQHRRKREKVDGRTEEIHIAKGKGKNLEKTAGEFADWEFVESTLPTDALPTSGQRQT
jgi:hypothetical protein